MKKIILFLLFVSSAFNMLAQPGSLDVSYNPGTGFDQINTDAYAIALQSNGRYIVGGGFSTFQTASRNNIVRITGTGTIDAGFTVGTGFTSDVYALALEDDEQIIVGGWFTGYNGSNCYGIARLNTNGTNDATFVQGTGFTGSSPYVKALAIQPDGKIIVGGNFTSYNGTARKYIARLNSNGSIDATFAPTGTGLNAHVYAIALQPDGKIIIGGLFTSYNGTARNYIARLNSDGSLDTGFNPSTGFNQKVYTLALQSDGNILVGGDFTLFGTTTRNYIARLTATGSLDANFAPTGTGLNSYVRTIALQSCGSIIVGGYFTSYNGTTKNRIVRLNSNGSLDASFSTGSGALSGFNAQVYAVAIQDDHKLFVSGYFDEFNGTGRDRTARLYLNPLITSIAPSSTLCAGDALTVSFNSNGTYTSNQFQVQLSDANGSFNNPINIGSTSTNGGTINCVIPSNTISGTGYRIRIVTTNPATGCEDYGVDITINALPTVVITANGAISFCAEGSVTLTSSSATDNEWSPNGETTPDITVDTSGTFSVDVTDINGCVGTSSITVTETLVDTSVSVSSLTLTANATGGATYQWIENCGNTNIQISGENTNSYTVTADGSYAVIVTQNSCSDTSSCYTFTSVEIIETASTFVKIYPNPSTTAFTLETNLSTNTTIQTEIKNTLGQIVYSFTEKTLSGLYKKTIDVNLGQGLYFLTLQTNDGLMTKKIEVVK